MPESEISTEYVPDDDDAQSYVEFLEQEMFRVKEKLKYSIPGTEEYLNASQAFEKISSAYRNLFDHYYSEESGSNDSGEENREKVSSLYVEETSRKEEYLMGKCKELRQYLRKLDENISECDQLMKRFVQGTDEYNEAMRLRSVFANEYENVLEIYNERQKEAFDRFKWGVNVFVEFIGKVFPIAVFIVLFHQSLEFESTGSYRSRTTSNLVSKMTPKIF